MMDDQKRVIPLGAIIPSKDRFLETLVTITPLSTIGAATVGATVVKQKRTREACVK